METLFFFDLEQTLISIWDDPVLCNVEKVRKFIADNDVRQVDIFSFAIWNDKDKDHFDKTMRSWLEREFGFTVRNVWTVDRLREIILWKMKADFDHTDFVSLWGKKRAFEEFCEHMLNDGTHATLIDDCVPNRTTVDHDRNLTICLRNVDDL